MNPITNNPSNPFSGIIILLIGMLIRYFIGRRRFNRRGIGGLQQFSNYETAVAFTFLEWVFKWVANLLILLALLLLLFGNSPAKQYPKQSKALTHKT